MSITSDIKGKQEEKIGLFCSICDYIISTHSDIQSVSNHGCCHDCFLTFCQARENEWKDGWRPDPETLDRYKAQKRILSISVKTILGE
ncbi:MAG TPA: hypothetical protein DF712_00990 [Balneola sp.]|nr:hypothetical protein [Balneola sp.]|tara:strand:- start:1312 stop:1575 length:264 start_codon:yes stop_codon:yes gene_type:complete